MPGEMPAVRIQISTEHFEAFRNDRPANERWELIGGKPVLMPPRSLIHQRIVGNISAALNTWLLQSAPEWQADCFVSLLPANSACDNPIPDVSVIDTEILDGQVHATRFYFVAEVVSGSDKAWIPDLKLACYQSHPNCLGVMFVRQDRIEADLHVRTEGWTCSTLTAPTERINIPVIGDIGQLEDLYRHTPLFKS